MSNRPRGKVLKISKKKKGGRWVTGIATLVSFFWPAYNIFKLEGEEGRKQEASIGAIATKGTKRERDLVCSSILVVARLIGHNSKHARLTALPPLLLPTATDVAAAVAEEDGCTFYITIAATAAAAASAVWQGNSSEESFLRLRWRRHRQKSRSTEYRVY